MFLVGLKPACQNLIGRNSIRCTYSLAGKGLTPPQPPVVQTDLDSMVVNVEKLLHIAVEVKLAVAGVDRWRVHLTSLGILWPPVTGSLDLHLGGSGCFCHTCNQRHFQV